MRAPSLSDERPRNSWDWYLLMQHSGAPTRLLDWTEGALIALYFAVRNKPGFTTSPVHKEVSARTRIVHFCYYSCY
jgi:hypothetical protein